MKNKDYKDIVLNIHDISNPEYESVEFNDPLKVYIVKTRNNKTFLMNEAKQEIENSSYDSIEINYPIIIASREGQKYSLKFENGKLNKV